MKALELLDKAFGGDEIKVKIDFIEFVGYLDYASAMDIFADQEQFKTIRVAEWTLKGYDKLPIDEVKWQRDLKNVKPEHRKRIEEDKPATLAHQLADNDTKTLILRKLVPKYLTDEQGNKIFKTEDEQEKCGVRILNYRALMKKVMDGITELFAKITEAGEQAKNSPEPENSES